MARAGLSTESVVAAAAELADERSLDAVSLGALATRLGVRAPSLYNHVSGLSGLHEAIGTLALREIGDALRTATVGKSGADAFRALAHAYRRYARDYPGRYQATVRAPTQSDGDQGAEAVRAIDTVFAVLSGFGLTGDDAIDATRTVRATLHGWVGLESGGGFGMDRSVDVSFDAGVTALIAVFENWGARG